MTTLDELSERVALVTGASRGIGAATAHALAAAGARVVLTHRDSQAEADAVLAALPGAGHRVVRASASDAHAIGAMVDSIERTEGRLDVLVNNAAMSRVVPHDDLDALDDELFDAIMRTNVRGVFATIRACRALLTADGGGTIVNISSMAATTASGSNVAYCASKAAVDNMTRSLARALAPKVRVLSVAPGLVDTRFTGGWAAEQMAGTAAATPLGALATCEDVADAVLVAVTRLGATTGAVIPVDGGRGLG